MNQQNNKTEEEFMRDLEDGKYRDFYLLYNRKSTDETENQKNSIEYQKSENLKFAQLKRLPIAKVTHTGEQQNNL
jgi:site-specific DNA recombinase